MSPQGLSSQLPHFPHLPPRAAAMMSGYGGIVDTSFGPMVPG